MERGLSLAMVADLPGFRGSRRDRGTLKKMSPYAGITRIRFEGMISACYSTPACVVPAGTPHDALFPAGKRLVSVFWVLKVLMDGMDSMDWMDGMDTCSSTGESLWHIP